MTKHNRVTTPGRQHKPQLLGIPYANGKIGRQTRMLIKAEGKDANANAIVGRQQQREQFEKY